ncbi:hydrolase 1, exosortase A system-associated [Paraurantiacibacter namhicola]|uniref:Alpha/beta hydrolase family protein n=1 Tax=Paraurantiacibacter namhicola TaxID=645517 RepID=A0A1C7D9H6_9SPHN|nr:hydrolase 1, exosortase A system-associated [Paraurantiacibacter namhicola]ANU08146.1 Alpha/beta hydrolase family protein [Paraurantiacibacter namhicola]
MTRQHIRFGCEADTLVGTLDLPDGEAASQQGLLIVSGGNEIRSGAFAGQSALAQQIAEAGHPVFRYDRRGIGDSTGDNRGFRGSEADIAAAIAAFMVECPDMQRITAFGNCDAASALMLAGGEGLHGLVLSNPWTFEDEAADAMPSEAIRARYAEKLKNPRELLRLLSGKVSFAKLFKGLLGALSPAPAPSSLAENMRSGLARFDGDVRFLVAERDRTGLAFLSSWDARDARIRKCTGATHAYVEPEALEWLLAQLLSALSDE